MSTIRQHQNRKIFNVRIRLTTARPAIMSLYIFCLNFTTAKLYLLYERAVQCLRSSANACDIQIPAYTGKYCAFRILVTMSLSNLLIYKRVRAMLDGWTSHHTVCLRIARRATFTSSVNRDHMFKLVFLYSLGVFGKVFRELYNETSL